MNEKDDATEQASRLASEVMAEIEQAASRPPPPPAAKVRARLRRRVSLTGLAIGVPVLAVLLAQNFSEGGLERFFDVSLSEAELRLRLFETVSEVVIEVEAFREDYDELPESLVEIAAPFEGEWRYEVVARDRYSIELVRRGQRVTFDSADDADVVFQEVRSP